MLVSLISSNVPPLVPESSSLPSVPVCVPVRQARCLRSPPPLVVSGLSTCTGPMLARVPIPVPLPPLGCEIVGNGRVAWWAESAPAGGRWSRPPSAGVPGLRGLRYGDLLTVALEFGSGMPLDA